MEYAEMGNLFYYQNTKNIFNEAEAFKFFCQTLSAVNYLHLNDIIHRDLKVKINLFSHKTFFLIYIIILKSAILDGAHKILMQKEQLFVELTSTWHHKCCLDLNMITKLIYGL